MRKGFVKKWHDARIYDNNMFSPPLDESIHLPCLPVAASRFQWLMPQLRILTISRYLRVYWIHQIYPCHKNRFFNSLFSVKYISSIRCSISSQTRNFMHNLIVKQPFNRKDLRASRLWTTLGFSVHRNKQVFLRRKFSLPSVVSFQFATEFPSFLLE